MKMKQYTLNEKQKEYILKYFTARLQVLRKDRNKLMNSSYGNNKPKLDLIMEEMLFIVEFKRTLDVKVQSTLRI